MIPAANSQSLGSAGNVSSVPTMTCALCVTMETNITSGTGSIGYLPLAVTGE